MDAKELERKTREIASLRWGVLAQSEHIDGVDYDCILHLDDGHWIAIETTCNTSIEKVRTDINNRLGFLRKNRIIDNIFVECYMVLGYPPTPNMVEYARKAKVTILSYDEFKRQFFDYRPYCTQRVNRAFGSAINLETGKNDTKKYIGVNYRDESGTKYRIADIVDNLKRGFAIILLGDYGTGKSRCIREVFNQLINERDYYTICINLRDNWGLKTKAEIIHRHFTELGLSRSSDMAVRLSDKGNSIFLLDGFDEIGSQSWTANQKKLVSLRKKALQGVAQIVSESTGGILISGRQQYFNSTDEMCSALGLNTRSNVKILWCPEEFTEEEMQSYLAEAAPGFIGNIPAWIPRKPLTYNVLSELQAEDIRKLNENVDSHLSYWNYLIEYICVRESAIRNMTLESATILQILKEVAHYILKCDRDDAIITPDIIGGIFHSVLGYAPDDDASIILQRLPGLGRAPVEGPNRCFYDDFLLHGLKASFLIDTVSSCNREMPFEKWGTKIDTLGCTFLQEDYESDPVKYEKYIKAFLPTMTNKIMTSILVTLAFSSDYPMNFKNVMVSETEFDTLSLSPSCRNITFSDCYFNELDISDCVSPQISFEKGCLINQIIGIGNSRAIPSWISSDCVIENYQMSQKASELRESGNITTPQMVLLIILQRIFFQRGSGRVREALFRGFEDSEMRYVAAVVVILIAQGYIKKIPCNGSTIYIPVRDKSSRVYEIKNELTRSTDPLWQSVSELQ